MRLTAVLIMLFIIQMGILILDNTYTVSDTSNPYENSSWTEFSYEANGSTSTADSSSIWSSMINPASFTGTGLITQILTALATVGATSVVVLIGLSVLGARSDLVLKIPLAILFLGVGAVPIWQFYGAITRESYLFGCAAGEVCSLATIGAFFMSGMLLLILVMAVISWWTGVDSG